MLNIKKSLKIGLLFLGLLPFANVSAKRYPGGTIRANVLDVAIFLEAVKHNEYSYEEKKVRDGKISDLVIIKEFRNFINDEEAIIASAPLMMGLLNAGHFNFKGYEKIKDTLFYSKKWSIFVTNDYEFVVLIPHSKYPGIKKRQDLSCIGLDPNKLVTINYFYYCEKNGNNDLNPLYDPYETYEGLKKQKSKETGKRGKININSLVSLFKKEDNEHFVNKRVYITGHGKENGSVLIAGLKEDQYETLRDKLDETSCSFLYASTCYGAGTVVDIQSKRRMLNKIKKTNYSKYQVMNSFMTNMRISDKKFIEITEGVRGESVYGAKSGIDKFFCRVNNFLYDQYIELKENIIRSKTIPEKLKKRCQLAATKEQIMLNGFSFLPKDNDYSDPLIVNVTDINKSSGFLKIFDGFVRRNHARCRFPGDEEMPYII
ncbi:hypothetical protein ACFLYA_01325 [Candidatus Dependentiae bacterium]